MTKPKTVCNQQRMRFPTAFLVPHPETSESDHSRPWEVDVHQNNIEHLHCAAVQHGRLPSDHYAGATGGLVTLLQFNGGRVSDLLPCNDASAFSFADARQTNYFA